MVSWEGQFSWQEHALTGRPDFLNYLHAGDVSWDELWELYRRQASPPEAVRSLMRLFHMFLSSEYDAGGCWLDPEGEVYARLRAWTEFALDNSSGLTVDVVQADLAGLLGSGLITPLYYQAAYLVWTESCVDRCATAWSKGQPQGSRSECPDLPDPDARYLPVYHPGPARFPHLLGDPSWNAALRSLIFTQYHSWNSAFAETVPDWEEEEAWTTVGGEG
jgi:hypothetical protein